MVTGKLLSIPLQALSQRVLCHSSFAVAVGLDLFALRTRRSQLYMAQFGRLRRGTDAEGARLHVAVVGAGVIGLSVAAHLVELPLPNQPVVTLVADKFSPHTTSDKSGGMIIPQDLTEGIDASYLAREERWVRITFNRMHSLYNSTECGDIGLTLVNGYTTGNRYSLPWWKDIVLGFRLAENSEKKMLSLQGWDVFAFSTYFMQCKTYLPWLLKQFVKAGGIVVQKKVHAFSELSTYDIVINCTGLGATELVGDHSLYPGAGHLVSVKAPWIAQFFRGEPGKADRAYVFPRQDDTILGGTFDTDNVSAVVDPNEVAKIIERCKAIMPSVAEAVVLDSWVGLRPMRKGGVRLEREKGSSHPIIIHCYGHGAHGVALSWGCAKEVADIIADCISVTKSKL